MFVQKSHGNACLLKWQEEYFCIQKDFLFCDCLISVSSHCGWCTPYVIVLHPCYNHRMSSVPSHILEGLNFIIFKEVIDGQLGSRFIESIKCKRLTACALVQKQRLLC